MLAAVREMVMAAPRQPERADWLAGAGELSELIRTKDWASTPLGARDRWPQPLRTAVSLVVENRQPMVLGWGPELTLIYNDACRSIAADRHPWALGRPLREVWPEAWPTNAPLSAAAIEGGKHLRLNRRGAGEDADFILSYGPVRLEDGRVGGILVTFQETTAAVQLGRLPVENAALLRALVEHGADSLIVHDLDGHILYVNGGTCSSLGFSRQELARMNIADVVIGFDPIHVGHQGRAREPLTVPGRLRHRDGTTFPVELRSVSFESHGERRFLLIGRDATERQRAEEERAQALAMLESALAQSPAGILIAEAPDVTIRWTNAAALAIRGASASPLSGIDVSLHSARWQTFRPDGSPYPSEDLPLSRAVLRGETTLNEEVIVRHSSGEDRWVSVNASPIRNAAGAVSFGIGVFLDVTERKRAEQALRASEHDLNRAQAVAHTGSWHVDARRNELAWSAETCRIFGVPEGTKLTYETFLEHVHPDDRERVDTKWQAALRGDTYEIEHRIIVGDEVKWVRERSEMELDDRGVVCGGFGTVQDVTETRRLVEALRAANERLTEADRRKDEFLAILAHELRNPLAPVLNSLYVLEHAPSGGEQTSRARAVIGRQVAHLTKLIDALLDVTRITRGKAQLQRARVDLNEITSRTVEDHRSVFDENDVRLELLPARDAVWVWGDPTRLTQVIGNLLLNAAKFTPKGGSTTVSVGVDPANEQALLIVGDTGCGIPSEVLSRLFKPFVQADTTLARSKGGLGLGLALVRGLVEMHGGSVSATSDGVGAGAVFTIRLPLDTSAAQVPAARQSASRAKAACRVLIIEDNVDAASSLREVLELEGHAAAIELGGPEGIARARAESFDVVLCDIGLPEMDGYAVARAMRADPTLRRIKLVALTGYAGPEDIARSGEAGFDAHLAKPPTLEALEGVLENCSRDTEP